MFFQQIVKPWASLCVVDFSSFEAQLIADERIHRAAESLWKRDAGGIMGNQNVQWAIVVHQKVDRRLINMHSDLSTVSTQPPILPDSLGIHVALWRKIAINPADLNPEETIDAAIA